MSEAAKKTTKTEKPAGTEATNEFDARELNIFQRVAAITAELGTVAKNLKVEVSKKNSYKAVSERDIIDAVKPLEEKYRVYSYPSDRKIIDDEILEGEKTDYNGNPVKTTTFFTRIQTTYTFVNIDNPTDTFSTIVFSEGIDTQDKGSGKAMTYADKYAVMKAYKISTGDDPDQEASEPAKYTRSNSQGNKPQGNYNSGNRNAGANNGAPTIMCRNCGNEIKDTFRQDGSLMTASEVAYYSSQRYGIPYCADCMKKLEIQRAGR